MVDIDSIRLVLDDELSTASLEALADHQITTNAHGEYHQSARLQHLRVYSRPGRTTISGSLSKFIYGTNLSRFDYRLVAPALDWLAEHLGLSRQKVRDARITRLEFGVCIELSQPVADYTSRLVQPPRTVVSRHGSTAVFHLKQRQLSFYDKRAEVLAKGGAVGSKWGPHVLRYEVRLAKSVVEQLGRPVTCGDLCHPDLYSLLGDGLLGYLEGVSFEERPILAYARTKSELREVLARLGLDAAGGLGAVLSTIDGHRQGGLVEREQASRQRHYVRLLHAEARYRPQPSHPLHDELVAAIYTAVHTS